MSRVRPLSATFVAAIALIALTAGSSAAADAPDFSASRIDCVPVATALRPGDALRCSLLTAIARPGMATDDITADMTIPPDARFDFDNIDNEDAAPNVGIDPTSVKFTTAWLGRMLDGDVKRVGATFIVRDDAIPDHPLQVTAKIHVPGWPDTTITSNTLTVTQPPADLSPSNLDCLDVNAGKLQLGDRVDCTLKLRDRALHEDATGVSVQVSLPQYTALAGGDHSYLSGATLVWINKLPGGVPSGVPDGTVPELHFSLTVRDDAPGGTLVFPQAQVSYVNPSTPLVSALSIVPANAQLTTEPGPGSLVTSALSCRDLDGAPTYPGETLACTLTATNPAGREGLEDVAAVAPVPAGTTAALAGLVTDGSFRFGPSVFGTLPTGTSKAYEYRVVVGDVAAGTRLAPTATLTGRSVPSGTEVSKAVTSPPLTTSRRAAPAATAPVAVSAASVAAATPSRASLICASKRTVTVNVKPPKGKHWKSVTLAFATKSVKAKKATGAQGKRGYYRAKLVFQGLPKGPLKVSVKGVTTAGKTVKSTRTYNLCVQKK
jgi:hypothetical protein